MLKQQIGNGISTLPKRQVWEWGWRNSLNVRVAATCGLLERLYRQVVQNILSYVCVCVCVCLCLCLCVCVCVCNPSRTEKSKREREREKERKKERKKER